MARAHADGYSLQFIGTLVGMSAQWVHQILRRLESP